MATQLMFYERVIPVSSQRHRNWSIEGGNHYEFARHVNSVPLVAVEIPHAAREYTIVFAGTKEAIVPVVILGIKDQENLYLTEEGGWTADYVPAFVRRYPFVFSTTPDGSQYTLCVDESWGGCNQEGRGERLFDEQGERTPFLQRLLSFHSDYQRSAKVTQDYCNKLKELELLDPKEANFTLAGGETAKLRGFMAVSREKLNALPAETLAELAKTGALELTYAHLLSMNNLSLVANRVSKRNESLTEAGAAQA
jgi:hypothetical protein